MIVAGRFWQIAPAILADATTLLAWANKTLRTRKVYVGKSPARIKAADNNISSRVL